MFSARLLEIDPVEVAAEIVTAIRTQVLGTLRRRGAVVGLSGGVDSSVVACLCAHALGGERVRGLLMPERDSSADALRLGRLLGAAIGIETIAEDITRTLVAAGCYERQAEAIRSVVPEYQDGAPFKITLPSVLDRERLGVSYVTVEAPDGQPKTARLPLDAYLQLVAATNFKQRTRAMMAYYHADRLNYAVAGTPNRLEYDQGFFVKGGDGAADFKPIAHLYKTQIYTLAAYVGVPEEIRSRPPTTDTFSMPQTQEEFFFGLPWDQMDLCLAGRDANVPAAEVAPAVGLTIEQVERVYRDIDRKRRGARYLHAGPILVRPVAEVGH